MSSRTIIPIAIAEVSQYAIDKPKVFDVLTAMMNIQPELDKEAGHGVLQGPTLFMSLKLTDDEEDRLVDLCQCDGLKLYILLRSLYMAGITDEQFVGWVTGASKPDFKEMYRDLLQFIPSMKHRGVLSRLS